MKKVIYLVLLVAVLIIAVMVVAKVIQTKNAPEFKPPAPTLGVMSVPVLHEDIADVRQFTGSLTPDSSFDLAAKVSGRLEEITVSVGDEITPKQFIAQIEDIEYVQAVAQAKANYETGKAQIAVAKIELEQAERDYDRNKQLHDSNVYSASQYEEAQTSYRAKEATYQMRVAEANTLKAILDNAETRLADTTLNADWSDGERYVGLRYVDSGALLSVNQPIINIIDIDLLSAKINVVEKDYPLIAMGHEATITTAAYPNEVFNGVVSQISPLLNQNTRQAEISIEIENEDHKLKPGMFVKVNIELGRYNDVQTVPVEAVVKRNDITGVFLLNKEENIAEFVPVTVGLTVNNRTVIESPKLDKSVITLGNHRLNDGSAVIDTATLETIQD